MASLDTLFSHLLPVVPSVPMPTVRHHLLQAAIRFCRTSNADRRALATFNTVAGQATYTLTAPADSVISKVVAVKLDGEKPGLDPLRPDEIPADAEATRAKPKWFCGLEGGAKLQLVYEPDAVYSVAVTVVVEPTSVATVIGDWLADRYGADIAYGALATLMAMPKKEWTDQETAIYYKGLFDAALLNAETEADQGFTRAPVRTRSVFGLR